MCHNFECEHARKCINEPICELYKCPYLYGLTGTLNFCHFCVHRKICPTYKMDKRNNINKK